MHWMHWIACFFGGAFLTNAVPHFVSGMLGRAFQTPFAKPHGEGLSSSTVNVLWGLANFVVSYLILVKAGRFDFAGMDVIPAGTGVLLLALFSARHFGRFHGGNQPVDGRVN